ncbi:MAG TPA: efflux RND transporter periplasmic adaptor subunit [Candidatus Acidoferrales bacterium]|nr:efflux RND transporter periplasmic adaptor subunit [Candidatus Acidoferrales bacterium]
MKTYRTGFIAALFVNIILVALVVGVWLHYRGGSTSKAETTSAAAQSASSSPSPSQSAPPQTETPLAPIQLSPQRLQTIGVSAGEVQEKNVEDEIRTTGNVAIDETGVAYVQLRFSGYIQKVFADATYQYIRRGQPLFTIYSPDLVATEREYLVARQNQQQVASSTVPGVAAGAASLVQAAADRLKQWGIPDSEISRLESSGRVEQELEIDSTVSGYITDREALPNKYVQPDTRLYTVADLSTVWVFAQVFQNDLGRVRVGAPTILTVDTYPGRKFSGRVDFIYPDVDPSTRTARVRLVFPNPDLKLTPGMFVNVILKIAMGRQIVIPASGVLQSGTRQITFVDHGNGNLEPRDVTLGAHVGDDFIVLKGLKAGERVVTSANFLIDSESQLQAALGSFAPPPPGAGAASAINAPQTNLELTTEPNPPHKGNNTFRVKVTDKSGSHIAGAQVNVTFFMPAMPAMGMAAMRTSVDLSERGNGLYEGSGTLGSGGTWQVTIIAKKNGQTVGTRQLNVNATGGM